MNPTHDRSQLVSEKLRETSRIIREVVAVTESAALSTVDGLARLQSLLTRLEQAGDEPGLGEQLRAELQREIVTLSAGFQFQDITSQQLGYVLSVLAELDPCGPRAPEGGAERGGAFDPAATTTDAGRRQAVADRVFEAGGEAGGGRQPARGRERLPRAGRAG